MKNAFYCLTLFNLLFTSLAWSDDPENAPPISTAPAEIISKTFTYLKASDLLSTSQVCTSFRDHSRKRSEALLIKKLRKVIQTNKYDPNLLEETISNPNAKDSHGNSLLRLALGHKDFKLARLLVQFGSDFSDESKCDRTPIQEVLETHGDHKDRQFVDLIPSLHKKDRQRVAEEVQLLIQKGADPNQPNRRRESALQYAAQTGNLEAMIVLLESGADANSKDMHGNTPLRSAVRSLMISPVEILLKWGAVPEMEWYRRFKAHGVDQPDVQELLERYDSGELVANEQSREEARSLALSTNQTPERFWKFLGYPPVLAGDQGPLQLCAQIMKILNYDENAYLVAKQYFSDSYSVLEYYLEALKNQPLDILATDGLIPDEFQPNRE